MVAALAVAQAGLIAPGLQLITAPQLIAGPHLIAAGPQIAVASAPAVVAVQPIQAIQPGYVAATRGAVHIAPLPGNTPLASHHLNLAPAPGTV